MNVYVGIDTSCYVTSAALVDQQGVILAQQRQLLPVKPGSLGLRQSEAVFSHVKQLPAILQPVLEQLHHPAYTLGGVGVSIAPRNAAGSYMPVFQAGFSAAQLIAQTARAPLYAFSHQQGHVRAAEIGQPSLPDMYLAIHLSGGTTELLRVKRHTWQIDRLGGTLDISAGQCIDRLGVALGLPFPAGPALEALAVQVDEPGEPIGIQVRGCDVHFSGAESVCKRRLEQGDSPQALARALFVGIGRALAKMLGHAYEQTGLTTAVLAGGVAANQMVKQSCLHQLKKRRIPVELYVADPQFAGDNAVGIALLAKEADACSAN